MRRMNWTRLVEIATADKLGRVGSEVGRRKAISVNDGSPILSRVGCKVKPEGDLCDRVISEMVF